MNCRYQREKRTGRSHNLQSSVNGPLKAMQKMDEGEEMRTALGLLWSVLRKEGHALLPREELERFAETTALALVVGLSNERAREVARETCAAEKSLSRFEFERWLMDICTLFLGSNRCSKEHASFLVGLQYRILDIRVNIDGMEKKLSPVQVEIQVGSEEEFFHAQLARQITDDGFVQSGSSCRAYENGEIRGSIISLQGVEGESFAISSIALADPADVLRPSNQITPTGFGPWCGQNLPDSTADFGKLLPEFLLRRRARVFANFGRKEISELEIRENVMMKPKKKDERKFPPIRRVWVVGNRRTGKTAIVKHLIDRAGFTIVEHGTDLENVCTVADGMHERGFHPCDLIVHLHLKPSIVVQRLCAIKMDPNDPDSTAVSGAEYMELLEKDQLKQEDIQCGQYKQNTREDFDEAKTGPAPALHEFKSLLCMKEAERIANESAQQLDQFMKTPPWAETQVLDLDARQPLDTLKSHVLQFLARSSELPIAPFDYALKLARPLNAWGDDDEIEEKLNEDDESEERKKLLFNVHAEVSHVLHLGEENERTWIERSPVLRRQVSPWKFICPVSFEQGRSKFAIVWDSKIYFCHSHRCAEKFLEAPAIYALKQPRRSGRVLVFGSDKNGSASLAERLAKEHEWDHHQDVGSQSSMGNCWILSQTSEDLARSCFPLTTPAEIEDESKETDEEDKEWTISSYFDMIESSVGIPRVIVLQQDLDVEVKREVVEECEGRSIEVIQESAEEGSASVSLRNDLDTQDHAVWCRTIDEELENNIDTEQSISQLGWSGPYDPVIVMEHQRKVQGNPENVSVLDGNVFYFWNNENKLKFLSDHERFEEPKASDLVELPTVVLIVGAKGTGKSVCARHLNSVFGLKIVSGPLHPNSSMSDFVEEGDCILEGTVESREQYENLLETGFHPTIVLLLETEPQICIQRKQSELAPIEEDGDDESREGELRDALVGLEESVNSSKDLSDAIFEISKAYRVPSARIDMSGRFGLESSLREVTAKVFPFTRQSRLPMNSHRLFEISSKLAFEMRRMGLCLGAPFGEYDPVIWVQHNRLEPASGTGKKLVLFEKRIFATSDVNTFKKYMYAIPRDGPDQSHLCRQPQHCAFFGDENFAANFCRESGRLLVTKESASSFVRSQKFDPDSGKLLPRGERVGSLEDVVALSRSKDAALHGCVFFDVPSTIEEAEFLQREGLLPLIIFRTPRDRLEHPARAAKLERWMEDRTHQHYLEPGGKTWSGLDEVTRVLHQEGGVSCTPDDTEGKTFHRMLRAPELMDFKLDFSLFMWQGFCVVSFVDMGKMVRGNHACVVVDNEYRLFAFSGMKAMRSFLCDAPKYLAKTQELAEAVDNVPTSAEDLLRAGDREGYISRSVQPLVFEALEFLGSRRLKHPRLSTRQTASIFTALFLRANNPNQNLRMAAKERHMARFNNFLRECELLDEISRDSIGGTGVAAVKAMIKDAQKLEMIDEFHELLSTCPSTVLSRFK